MGKELTGYPSLDRPNEIGASFFEKHPIIPDMSIYGMLKLLSMMKKEKIAVSSRGLKVSYGHLIDKDAITIGAALEELGVKSGEIVAVSMPNLYQAVAAWIACNRIGAVVTFLDNEAGIDETCEHLNNFESPILINYDTSTEINERIKKATKVRHIITLDKEKERQLDLNGNYHLTSRGITLDFHSLASIASERRFKLERPHFGNENAMILFTSGSTGKPKSVLLTNKNIIAAEMFAGNTSHTANIKGEKTLTCVPFRYPYGSITSLLTTLLWGKEAVIAPDIGSNTVNYYLAQEIAIIFGSPALLELVMRFTDPKLDLSSVSHFISGGDFLQLAQYERGKKFFADHGAPDVEIGDGFGNAETVAIQSTPVGVPQKIGTAGKMLVGTKYRLVDPETYKDVPYGTEGLLLVTGKHVFKEYYKQPELTEQAFVEIDGKKYFNTGTLGKIDEDGYWKVTGRMSRFYIMSSLFKVYMDHVQSVISNLSCVRECAVVAVSDEELLYANKVYIVLNDGYEPTPELEAEIFRLFHKPTFSANGEESQLKTYEIPKYVEFVPELPRIHGTEKVDYPTLTEDAKKHVLTK